MSLFISAFFLGLVFNAAPGAVFAESLRRGLQQGYYPALYVQFGSLVGDATWAVLGLLGVGLLFQIPSVRLPLSILGALYLLYLGGLSLKNILKKQWPDPTATDKKPSNYKHGALTAGVTMSLTNPANVVYWGALGSVFAGFGVAEPTRADYGVFFAGFMTSSVLWCFVCAGLIHLMHRLMSPRIAQGLNVLCGLCLIALAGRTLYVLL